VLHTMFSECGGEMDAVQFAEYFGGLLGINDEEANGVFLKIDFDNDGKRFVANTWVRKHGTPAMHGTL
jgi:hypothetical protein